MEAELVSGVDGVWVSSDTDAVALRDLFPDSAPVFTVPNVIDDLPPMLPEARREAPVLLYPGSFGYPPNLDAGRWLIDEIWPAVQEALPGTELILGGAWSDRVFGPPAVPGLELSGTVADLAPWWRRASIIPVPLRAGAGTRLKILEAFSLGVPVISTRKGCEGLDLEAGRHLLIAEEVQDWVDQVSALHCYIERRRELVRAGRAFVEGGHTLGAMTDAVTVAIRAWHKEI